MNNIVVIVIMNFESGFSFFINAIVSFCSISKSMNLNQIENCVLNSEIDRIVVQIDLKSIRHIANDM